jgi:hypothetical protein
MNGKLGEGLEKQEPVFQLYHTASFGKDEVEAILYFRKSHINDMYFFEKYYLQLEMANRGEELIQPFYIYKGRGITLKEGYNLLSGRSVNKDLINRDGQAYNAWLQLDLSAKENDSFKIRHYYEQYGFELEKVLDQLPVKELKDPGDREKLIRSLEKGNLQPVCLDKDGKERKIYIEANPRFKCLNVFDSSLVLIREFSRPLQKTEGGPALEGNVETESKSGIPGIREEERESQKPKRKRISI